MKGIGSFLFLKAAGIILFIVNVLAIYLLLRGHNLPGGGFIGGLAAAMAVLLYGLAIGFDEMEEQLRVDPIYLATIGLAIALVTSMAPMLLERPFLEHFMAHVKLPFFGELHVGTTLIFDIGVLLVVVGITTKIIFVLARSTKGQPALRPEEVNFYASPSELPIEESRPDHLERDPNQAPEPVRKDGEDYAP